MNREELLNIICSMLPYGLIMKYSKKNHNYDIIVKGIEIEKDFFVVKTESGLELKIESLDDLKIYIRPMSDITDIEKETLGRIKNEYLKIAFLNKCHLDYCDLLNKGLALLATKGMYINFYWDLRQNGKSR